MTGLVTRDVTVKQHPQALRPFLPEIDEFIRFCHFKILHPLLRCVCIPPQLCLRLSGLADCSLFNLSCQRTLSLININSMRKVTPGVGIFVRYHFRVAHDGA